ncbi:DUF3631 domain-containing protein [Rhodococcus ruber]|uniref:DUF3631 domain-containing protein n=1 Tax=Rhodococcus ruber TaxID=1830 RepID=UPI00177BCDFF|nr:DUF3631 domain-containing protein [Rhodococcus ruber]MBD8057231.1 DUF3631 domain-containing protein [Rhodococcus ruber]
MVFLGEHGDQERAGGVDTAGGSVDTLDGAAILDDVTEFLRWYSVYPDEHCASAYALWLAHTHAVSAFYVSPRIIFSSPEPGSGKTRDLELGALLAHNPRLTISATTAAIYRRISASVDEGEMPPTFFYDEVDAIFGRGASPQTEDLRALLNAGYKRGATVDRCEGDAKNMKVREFPVFAPAALAGLAGNMPATITTRAVTIHKRKRAPGEKVHPYRERDAEVEAKPIREDLAAWMRSVAERLAQARPKMPRGVEDRPAEVWEALLAIADAAGGHWPETARAACRHFVLDSDPAEQSLGVQLLADCRGIFNGRDRVATEELITALRNLDEAPWSDLHGRMIDVRTLAKLLKPYGVRSTQIRLGERTVKGYTAAGVNGFHDAWKRYLPTDTGVGAKRA